MKLSKEEILEYQQNRPPYLMIDYADEVIPGKSAKGYKDLKEDEKKLKGIFGNVDLKLDELQVEEYDLQKAIEDITKKISSYKRDGVQDKYYE